jgi:hypothetical protein
MNEETNLAELRKVATMAGTSLTDTVSSPVQEATERLSRAINRLGDSVDRLGHKTQPVRADTPRDVGNNKEVGGGSPLTTSLHLLAGQAEAIEDKINILISEIEL